MCTSFLTSCQIIKALNLRKLGNIKIVSKLGAHTVTLPGAHSTFHSQKNMQKLISRFGFIGFLYFDPSILSEISVCPFSAFSPISDNFPDIKTITEIFCFIKSTSAKSRFFVEYNFAGITVLLYTWNTPVLSMFKAEW